MSILDPDSLVNTVDNLNERLLRGEAIDPVDGLEAARWIASLQGLKGCYREMFAPTPADFERGITVFTGEKLTHASARHIMGEEAARAVWLLGRQDSSVRASYDRATVWMHHIPAESPDGTFCCGRCTDAFWRHFLAADFEKKEAFLLKGLQTLRNYRLGDGTWSRFPFFYTIYTLLEVDLKPAHAELEYARANMERYLKRSAQGVVAERRQLILEKALDIIN